MSLEELGLEIRVDEHQPPRLAEKKPARPNRRKRPRSATCRPKRRRSASTTRCGCISTQMGEIPLLTREEEISLAKKIEINSQTIPAGAARERLRHEGGDRHSVPRSQGRAAVDRTIQGVDDRSLERRRSRAHAAQLRTLEELRKQNLADFAVVSGRDVARPCATRPGSRWSCAAARW